MKKVLAMTLALVLLVGLMAGCKGPTIEGPSVDPNQSAAPSGEPGITGELTFAEGTVLRMACGYNNAKTGLRFDAEVAAEGVQLLDGKTYHTGDFKPTWVAVMDKLGFQIEDLYQGNSASEEFEYWRPQLDQVDILSGTAAKLTEAGAAGDLVDIAQYLDVMPNFKAYLDTNPIVRMTITGDTEEGSIYYSPYFDGVNDIERMPLMRTDWVVKLLDGEGAFTASASNTTKTPVYEPYMPTSGKIEVDVVTPDGTAVEKVTKDYDTAGNIVAKMNAAGTMDGVAAVNMLRTYIDEAYAGYYGTQRSDLFVGQNAAWDADELVALLRCVVANPQTLNGTDKVDGLFSREDNNNQRRVDMVHFAGHLFGVRGLESRKDYLYVDTDGALHDARADQVTYEAMEKMNDMAKEGLISEGFVGNKEENSEKYLKEDRGFMHYDYNQTQTLFNEKEGIFDEGEMYMAAMPPVARWYDGTDPNGVYMRFAESWRSVKTDGWGISRKGVEGNEDKLNAALKLIDFAFSEEGQILMSYGPEAWRSTETFTFNGKQMPKISDACREELWKLGKGNYTNYARQYLGSTLSFAKSQAFEFQCTTEVGRQGAGYISNAIGLGTIKHPELAVTDNAWYTSVPTTLPLTKPQNDVIGKMTDLGNDGKYSPSKGKMNVLVDIIAEGYNGANHVEGINDAASAVDTFVNTFSGAQYLDLQNEAWEAAVEFYNAQQ